MDNDGAKSDKGVRSLARYKNISTADIITALEAAAGFESVAATKLGMPVEALKKRVQRSEKLQLARALIVDRNCDVAEAALMTLIREKNFKAIRYYLDTHGRSRGYGVNPEGSVGSGGVNVNVGVGIGVQAVGDIPTERLEQIVANYQKKKEILDVIGKDESEDGKGD